MIIREHSVFMKYFSSQFFLSLSLPKKILNKPMFVVPISALRIYNIEGCGHVNFCILLVESSALSTFINSTRGH